MSKTKPFLLPMFFIVVFVSTIWIASERSAPFGYRNVIVWDTEGYYIYLPAVFIYHGFEGIPAQTIIDASGNKYLNPWPGTNKIYTKYTCGEAILMAPFWLIAHGIASLIPERFPPDGFSFIYAFSLIVAVAFYLTFGLYVASLILRPFFSDFVILLALMSIWLGTSFIQYTGFMPGNSHVFSFLLISLFVLQTPAILERPRFRPVFFYGITYGWIILVRPTNGVVALYFLLYQVRSIHDLRERMSYLLRNISYWLLFAPAAFLMLLPQLFYWHYATNHWLIFSYVGEGFIYWNHPKAINVLFDAQNGFFIYAPIMLAAIPGLTIGWRDRKYNMPVSAFIIAIALYTFASWGCWWYGGSYGHRAFIDFFPFFLIPMCVVFQKLIEGKAWVKYPSLVLICILLFLSVRLNAIYTYPWEGPQWGWHQVLEKYKQAVYMK